ncbi:Hypothetical predicted protein [Mytilus galloprovincialis]|uniref:cellulase n=1 Tax=Mytilus galloprovincialis TaxID=29158 RepID=A0A8B6G9A5_MYTGA|nr:Hypothetical predicted protein [Mytilus galloprovincialis]
MLNEAGYLQLFHEIQKYVKVEEEKSSEADVERKKHAFGEILESAERQFLRHLIKFREKSFTADYPRLVIINLVDKEKRHKEEEERKKKEEEERKKGEEEKKKQENGENLKTEQEEEDIDDNSKVKSREANYCFSLMCENEEGWHDVPETIPFPEFTDGEEEETYLSMAAPYAARINSILKYSGQQMAVIATPAGKQLQEKLLSHASAVTSEDEVEKAYNNIIKDVTEQDEEHTYGGLKKTSLLNGKTLWLCGKHREKVGSITEQRYKTQLKPTQLEEDKPQREKTVVEAVSNTPTQAAAGQPKPSGASSSQKTPEQPKSRVFNARNSKSPGTLKRQTSQACNVMMKELLITVLLACLSNVNAENQGVYITQKWPGGFHGYFILRPDHTLHGWNATLTLSADVDKLTIWAADIVSSSSGNTFVIKNKGFSADVAKNDEIKIEFQGDKRGMSNPPSGTISIGGAGALGSGGNTGGGGTGTGSGSNIGGGPSVPPYTGQGQSQMKHDYSKAMTLSILFFDAQRSGRLSGTNNPIPWRGDSALGDNGDGHDLSGGWYDAGDHVKFNLPMSYSAHVLGWGLQKFKDAYQRAGQLDMMYDMLKWPLDYFLKCWEPNKQTYWVQVGDGHADHGFWGRPEDMHMGRPAFKITPGNPGSDVAGNTASAFAIGAIVFKDKDAGYAGRLLDAAKSIYQFAKSHPGIYSNSVPQSKDFYGSNGWKDEMCEAAAELFKATGDQQYLNDAKQWFSGGTAWGYSWDDKTVGCQLLLWEATQDNQYKAPVEAFVNSYKPGGGVPYTRVDLYIEINGDLNDMQV